MPPAPQPAGARPSRGPRFGASRSRGGGDSGSSSLRPEQPRLEGHHTGASGHPPRERWVRDRREREAGAHHGPPPRTLRRHPQQLELLRPRSSRLRLAGGGPHRLSRLRQAGQGPRRRPRGQLLVPRLGGLPAPDARELEDGPDESRTEPRVPGPDGERLPPGDRGASDVHDHRRALEKARPRGGSRGARLLLLGRGHTGNGGVGTRRPRGALRRGPKPHGPARPRRAGHGQSRLPAAREARRRVGGHGKGRGPQVAMAARGWRVDAGRSFRAAVAVPLRSGSRHSLLPSAPQRGRTDADLGPAARPRLAPRAVVQLEVHQRRQLLGDRRQDRSACGPDHLVQRAGRRRRRPHVEDRDGSRLPAGRRGRRPC